MQTAITHGIRISVESFYQPQESLPLQHRYIFAYRITIQNEGAETVKLLRRHWHIIESNGVHREVEGEGVVGEQPIISPGQSFQYTSWCPLATDTGKMYGTYSMIKVLDEMPITVIIPEFLLVPPFKLN